MRNYYIFIVLLGIFCLSLVGLGFIIVGTPTDKQGQTYDTLRLSSMATLSGHIQSYTNENNKLPVDLTAFPQNIKIDPKTKKEFDYKILTKSTYQLCTTFSADNNSQSNYYGRTQTTHKKGYDCITFYPSSNTYKNYNSNSASLTPTPTPPPYYNVSPSMLVKVDDNISMRIVSVQYINGALEVTLEIKNTGDKAATADLSKIQMSYDGFNSGGSSTAVLTGYSFNHIILSNTTTTKSLIFKRVGEPPYTFKYVGESKTVDIATASQL